MIEINNKKKCLTCGGSGMIPIHKFGKEETRIQCPYCKGKGYIESILTGEDQYEILLSQDRNGL